MVSAYGEQYHEIFNELSLFILISHIHTIFLLSCTFLPLAFHLLHLSVTIPLSFFNFLSRRHQEFILHSFFENELELYQVDCMTLKHGPMYRTLKSTLVDN